MMMYKKNLSQRKVSPLWPRLISFTNSKSFEEVDYFIKILCFFVSGENIYKLVAHELDSRSIPWLNCVAFGSDNAPVMTGRIKGVIAYMKKKHDSIYMSGCPCHLIHIAAEKASNCLPFKLDEVLVDTFYYLDKSSTRLGKLEVYQRLYEVDHLKILKHVSTRWLSAGVCVDRILENWDALLMLFRDAFHALPDDAGDCREKRNFEFYRSPTNKLYCLFLQDTFKIFDSVNILLQQDAPLIHRLRRILHKLMRDLLLRYKLPGALLGRTVTDVSLAEGVGQRKDEDLLIGDGPRDFIQRKNEVHLREKRLQEFYSVTRQFFTAACTYIKDKLPLNDDLLRHAEVVDVKLRLNAVSSTDLMFFLRRFPVLLPPGEMQFVYYMNLCVVHDEPMFSLSINFKITEP
jgi:hypothetical protein